MKRFLAVVLSACLLFVGCGTQAGVKETAKDTYEKINAAADSSDLIMSSVLAAWYFAIDEGDEYATNFEAGCLAFKTEVGIPASCDVKP